MMIATFTSAWTGGESVLTKGEQMKVNTFLCLYFGTLVGGLTLAAIFHKQVETFIRWTNSPAGEAVAVILLVLLLVLVLWGMFSTPQHLKKYVT